MTRQRIILLDTGVASDSDSPADATPMPFLVPIDLSKGEGHEHPDFRKGQLYLYKVYGNWYCGRPHRQWFGWTFSGWAGGTVQWDAPGSNSSKWEYIYELHDGELPSGKDET